MLPDRLLRSHGSDDCMVVTRELVRHRRLEKSATRSLILGDDIRDFSEQNERPCWFPYNPSHDLQPLTDFPEWSHRSMAIPHRTGN